MEGASLPGSMAGGLSGLSGDEGDALTGLIAGGLGSAGNEGDVTGSIAGGLGSVGNEGDSLMELMVGGFSRISGDECLGGGVQRST